MMVSAIIVNYNTGPVTKACVESLLKQKLPFPLEIIVVDNASSDESVSFLRSDFPEIAVIANRKNLGLAAGVNTAIAKATGDYYLVLNPDVVVLPGAITDMVEYMEKHKKAGMAGGKLLSPNGRLQYSCFRFYTPLTVLQRRTWLGKTKAGRVGVARFLMKDYDHKSPREVDWLMGSCLLLRAEAVQEVGGMDERFFLYFEDVDWCRRMWEAGWRVVYLPTANFSHYYQRSSQQGGAASLVTNRVVREHIKSAIKYFWKYRGKLLPT
ncbi:MAG: glycosyltransferase family 2 protein [bacterium]